VGQWIETQTVIKELFFFRTNTPPSNTPKQMYFLQSKLFFNNSIWDVVYLVNNIYFYSVK